MVRPRGHDGVVAAVVRAAHTHPVFEFVTDVDLGDRGVERGEQHRLDVGQRGVGSRRCGFDSDDLGVIFDLTSGLHEGPERLQPEVGGEPRPFALRRRRRIETDTSRAAQGLEQALLEMCTRGLGEHGRPRPRRFRCGSIAVAAIGPEDQVVGGHHDPAVRAGEAGQPANVGEIGVEQSVATMPCAAQCLLHDRDPSRVVDRGRTRTTGVGSAPPATRSTRWIVIAAPGPARLVPMPPVRRRPRRHRRARRARTSSRRAPFCRGPSARAAHRRRDRPAAPQTGRTGR